MGYASIQPHEPRRYSAKSVEGAAPNRFLLIDRYREAFMAEEHDAFVDAVEKGAQPEVAFENGRRALVLTEAAYVSLRERRLVRVSEIA